jgi:hypothetical protein
MTKNDIDRIKDYLDILVKCKYRGRATKLTFEIEYKSSMLHIAVIDKNKICIYESCRYENSE